MVWAGVRGRAHLVGLLVGGAPLLGVLVGFEQQVDQPGDGPGVPQRGLVLRAQGQVTDQTHHRLEEEEGEEEEGEG